MEKLYSMPKMCTHIVKSCVMIALQTKKQKEVLPCYSGHAIMIMPTVVMISPRPLPNLLYTLYIHHVITHIYVTYTCYFRLICPIYVLCTL